MFQIRLPYHADFELCECQLAKMKDFLQSFWRRVLALCGLLPDPPKSPQLDEQWRQSLRDLSVLEVRPKEDLTADLAAVIEAKKIAALAIQEHWHTLSYREQQITALTCLSYTNRQIAAQLMLSPSTVASHMRKVLTKFKLHSKAELRQVLSGWDFRSWRDTR